VKLLLDTHVLLWWQRDDRRLNQAARAFDRALVAQALVEGATVVTHDRALAPYDVPTIWT
jgi:PIN domain nuclease of toxin-antitoxin system